jgi:hypothetical protein
MSGSYHKIRFLTNAAFAGALRPSLPRSGQGRILPPGCAAGNMKNVDIPRIFQIIIDIARLLAESRCF